MTLIAMANSATYPLAGHTADQTCICTRLGGSCMLNRNCSLKSNIKLFNVCKKSWVV